MTNSDLKPGDMIEWAYRPTGKSICKGKTLWSSTMRRWVPIGEPALLVSVTDETYAWLTPEGVFNARVNDNMMPGYNVAVVRVIHKI